MNLFTIIIIILAIISCILGFTNFYKKYKYNKEIDEQNKKLQKENDNLTIIFNGIKNNIEDLEKQITERSKELNRLKDIENNQEEIAKQSFNNYCDILDNEYKSKEEEYNKLLALLENSYDDKYKENAAELAQVRMDLDKMKQTRAAAIEAERREKEIENNIYDYCVIPTQDELDDIQTLERIKSKLNQPRILCMLIWSTYYQKRLTQLCNDVLGTSPITGIYKITNQITKQCYVGQGLDIANRWKQHAKCGLGIDTPAGNKLYKAMLEDGLYNFSFELLEECSKEQLDEKEKFYIELYQSKEYGYNSTAGNK